nr:hypothetical protein [uncultured Oribacterium sp.]
MGYSLFFLLYCFIICLAYGFSFYLYLLLELSVKQKKEVPDWFYRIGQSMQDRIHRVKLEDVTNYPALQQSRFFLRGMLLLSFFSYLFFHAKSHDTFISVLNCAKAQFVICLVMSELTKYLDLSFSPKEKRRYYSPSFAVSGCFIISSVLLLLFAVIMEQLRFLIPFP